MQDLESESFLINADHAQKMKAAPIGVFDSGLGGLTVVRELLAGLPKESMIYFGDTARVPYGDKSRETVVRYALEIADFLALLGSKILVVACNTVSALALEELKSHAKIPVINVIDPAVEEAARLTRSGHIAVLGTKATIRSGVYQRRFSEILPGVKVSALACPLFVPLVEEQLHNHLAAKLIAQEYLKPLAKEKPDTVLLGCTHYPLLREAISEILGPEINILDSSKACVKKIDDLLISSQTKSTSSGKVLIKYFVSDDTEAFKNFGENFLGRPLECVEHAIPRSIG